jgi:cytoskeletal protein RodZ
MFMKLNTLRDQRGVAMLLELVLVAAVLTLVGVALYQSNHQTHNTAADVSNKPTVATATATAEAAAKQLQDNTTAEAGLSAAPESAASDFQATGADVTNLGDSFNENNF